MSERIFRSEALKAPAGVSIPDVQNFIRNAPPGKLDLEIGCGVGWHPIQYATVNPDRALIALERTSEKFRGFASRIARHSALTNLFPVHADALPFVAHVFSRPDPLLSRVFLHYPNPSPKNPAQRWVRMPFFGFLLERVVVGGEILIVSNSEEYLQEALKYGPRWSSDRLRIHVSGIHVVEKDRPPRTHFEKKYLERGEPCGEVLIRRLS